VKTRLSDRTLWFDGTNEVMPAEVAELLLNGVHPSKIATSADPEIERFNQLADESETIAVGKIKNNRFDYTWDIPEEYKTLNVESVLLEKLQEFVNGPRCRLAANLYSDRLNLEIGFIRKYKLDDIFRTILFIVDTLERTNTVWGVGRGSSCASLALFLTGINLVDPVKYDIPPEEFFHS